MQEAYRPAPSLAHGEKARRTLFEHLARPGTSVPRRVCPRPWPGCRQTESFPVRGHGQHVHDVIVLRQGPARCDPSKSHGVRCRASYLLLEQGHRPRANHEQKRFRRCRTMVHRLQEREMALSRTSRPTIPITLASAGSRTQTRCVQAGGRFLHVDTVVDRAVSILLQAVPLAHRRCGPNRAFGFARRRRSGL